MYRWLVIVMIGFSTQASALSGRATCNSQSMTICQDEFCFATFDHPAKPDLRLVLDFDNMTYVVPEVIKEVKSLKILDIEQKGKHYSAKFTVDLADGHSGNVKFISNDKDNGQIDMSAAIRIAYAATKTSSSIIAVTLMSCRPN